jgi:hypothetical protein
MWGWNPEVIDPTLSCSGADRHLSYSVGMAGQKCRSGSVVRRSSLCGSDHSAQLASSAAWKEEPPYSLAVADSTAVACC